MRELKKLLYNFYTTERCSFSVSDGGGPFGFDIHHALEINYLIKKYNIERIVETGTNMGDTAEYLAKNYPELSIITTETVNDFFNFSKKRLKKYSNVLILNESSDKVTSIEGKENIRTLYYLDAHWEEYWPLKDEIKNIEAGIICVGDFNIGNSLYGYDHYGGIVCDAELIRSTGFTGKIYTNNPHCDKHPFPILQNGRLGGRAYFCKNIQDDFMSSSDYFKLHN
jgi:hypothetical protein